MLREIRIYWRLRPFINEFKEVFKMRLSLNMILQTLMTAGQAGNAILDFVPAGKKPVVAAGLGVIQGIVAFLAHFSNPDGTNAKTSYIPPKK